MWMKPVGQPQSPRISHRSAPDEGGVWPTPEQELLLRAALWPGDEAIAAWSEWASRVDFLGDYLDEASFRLLPLVYRNLERLQFRGSLMLRLKGIYRHAWAKNVTLFDRGQRVLEKLHASEIDTIALKGLALSILYYKDCGTRPMSDVDILVPTCHAESALKCLIRDGWRTLDMRDDGDLRYRWAATLVNDADQQLDLHWHALHECVYPEADDDFWAEAVPVEIMGVTTKALGAADNLLHTIVHGICFNVMPPIRWAADAALIIRSSGEGLCWERLLAQARKRKLLLRIGAGLQYLHEHLKVPIPSEVLRKCRERRPSAFEQTEYELVGKPMREVNDSVFGGWLLVILTYRRITCGQRFWPRLLGFADYARYRLFVSRRREIFPALLRRLPGKIGKIRAKLSGKIIPTA
jgi:hypothetical protein